MLDGTHTLAPPAVVARAPWALPDIGSTSIEAAEALALASVPSALTPLAALVAGLVSHELALLAAGALATRTLAQLVDDARYQLVIMRAHSTAPMGALVGAAGDARERGAEVCHPLWAAGACMHLAACAHERPWAMCSLRATGTGGGAEMALTLGGRGHTRSSAGLVSASGRLALAPVRTPDAHRREVALAWASVESIGC